MTKEETKQKLRKAGYRVADDNSVVTVIIEPGVSMKTVITDIKGKLSAWGYDASFAIRQHKGTLEGEVPESEQQSGLVDDESDSYDEETVEDDNLDVSDESEDTADSKRKQSKTVESKSDADKDDDTDYFDEEDADMLLNEDSIQFSLEDFGMDF